MVSIDEGAASEALGKLEVAQCALELWRQEPSNATPEACGVLINLLLDAMSVLTCPGEPGED